MPILIILGILTVYGVSAAVNKPQSKTVYSQDMHDQILKEMTGKSKAECRKILRKYRK